MANRDHLAKLKEGIAACNEWRSQYDQTIPDLDGADLVTAELSRADLRRVHLNAADLSNADLSRANLNWAYLNNEANLSGATLRQARVGAAELTGANLSNAELSVARFRGTDFRGANLSMANLDRSDLRKANFSSLDLSSRYRKTNLSGAYLGGANLSKANLTGAILKEADLSGANLSNADFSGADLTGAKLQSTLAVGTIFAEADLTGCKVHGIAAWDLNLEGAKQSKLITAEGEQPPIQVDDLEVVQFIYLLLNRKRLRKVITTLGEKAVLILGRLTERRDLLDGIADKLRSLGYLPIIFDFDRPTDRDLTETVNDLGRAFAIRNRGHHEPELRPTGATGDITEIHGSVRDHCTTRTNLGSACLTTCPQNIIGLCHCWSSTRRNRCWLPSETRWNFLRWTSWRKYEG